MRFGTETPIRILAAPPGVDSQVKTGREIIMANGTEIAPWHTVGVAPMMPRLTVSDRLLTIVLDAAGSYEELEKVGISQQTSLALVQVVSGTPIFNLAPASMAHFSIQTDPGNQYRGQVFFQLLGPTREIPWGDA